MKSSISIKIRDEDIGFKFTMPMLEMMGERMNLEYYKLLDFNKHKQPFRTINNILFCGNYVFKRGKDLADTYTVDDWIEEMTFEDFGRLWRFFKDSMIQPSQQLMAIREFDEAKEQKLTWEDIHHIAFDLLKLTSEQYKEMMHCELLAAIQKLNDQEKMQIQKIQN